MRVFVWSVLLFCLLCRVSSAGNLGVGTVGTWVFNVSAHGVPDGNYQLMVHWTATPHYNGQTSGDYTIPVTITGGTGTYTMGGLMAANSPSVGSESANIVGVVGHPDWTASASMGLTWNLGQQGVANWTEPVAVTMTGTSCPPQPGPVVFELGGALSGSGANVKVSLRIQKDGTDAEVFSFTQRSGPQDQPAQMYAAPSISGLPGEFGYEWFVADTLVASGSAECGSPVPGAKFSDNVGNIVTDGPYLAGSPEMQGPEVNNNQTPPTSPSVGENGGSVTSPPPNTPPAPTPPSPVTADPPPPSNPYTGNTSGGSPGSTLSGNMTKDDFYQSTRAGTSDAIKDNLPKILGAIANAGGGGEPPGDAYKDPNGNSAKFRVPEDGSVRQAEGTLSSKVSAVAQKINNGRQQVTEATGAVSDFASKVQGAKVPTPDPGKTLDGFKVAFKGVEYAVDLSPYESVIDWIRQLCLMAVTFAFWKYEIKIITQAFQV